jgi:hypothetical protein
MKSMAVLVAFFFFFSMTVASAAEVPNWWIGPKDEYERLVEGAKKEGFREGKKPRFANLKL